MNGLTPWGQLQSLSRSGGWRLAALLRLAAEPGLCPALRRGLAIEWQERLQELAPGAEIGAEAWRRALADEPGHWILVLPEARQPLQLSAPEGPWWVRQRGAGWSALTTAPSEAIAGGLELAWGGQEPPPMNLQCTLPPLWRRTRLLVGIKTFNRLDYLRECVASLQATACNERFELALVVADDGSSDGTLAYLDGLRLPFHFEQLRHQRRYVAAQFNAIAERSLDLGADFSIVLDDDVHFKRHGWMSAYHDAALRSGFHHLCHLNLPHYAQLSARRGEAFPPPRQLHREWPLEAHANVERAMGALFTFTPAVLDAVGFADEANFFVRGGWHADYSARCCRAGFNELERFWDLWGSNDYLQLQNTKGGDYRSSIAWDDPDFKRAATPAERERRAALRSNPDRLHLSLEQARNGEVWSLERARAHRPRGIADLFEQVFVLNLDRRPDRMAAMDARLRRLGIPYQRFAAFDGLDPAVQQDYQRYRAGRPGPDVRHLLGAREFFSGGRSDAERTAHIEARVGGPAIRSAGAWAYLLGYRALLERCVEQELESVLILDDDCLFHRDFHALLDACYQELPRNWRLFQLGTMQYDWPLVRPYSKHLYLPDGVLVASHAVGLQRETFPVLLEGIARWSLPFDIGPLQDCSRLFGEASFVAQPNLIIQEQSESDINSSDVVAAEVLKKANVYRWHLPDYA